MPRPACLTGTVGSTTFCCGACGENKPIWGRRLRRVSGARTWVCAGCAPDVAEVVHQRRVQRGDGVVMRLRRFFRENPDEVLTIADIAVKLDCSTEAAGDAVRDLKAEGFPLQDTPRTVGVRKRELV